jgi:MFS family permease
VFIYCCLFASGAARTFMWAASAAFLPGLVERQELSRAINFNATVFQSSSIVGPILGGVLIGLAREAGWSAPAAPVYALNGIFALICCALIACIRQRHVVPAREPMSLRNLLTGFSFVFSNRVIFGIITLDMFAVLLGGAVALLPIYAKEILHVGPIGLGFLEASLPAGAVFCTFVLAHRPPLRKAGRALLWSVTVFGLATVVFGISKWFWLSMLMLVTCGFADNISVVVRHTLVQLLTPDQKRGRVSAVNNLFVGTSNELGGFESGLVAHVFGRMMGNPIAFGAVVAAVSGGIGTILVVGAVAWIWPEIRKYGRLDAH